MMDCEEGSFRIEAVKKVLTYITHTYDLTTKGRQIRAIRFLNGTDDLNTNNLTAAEIDRVVDNHKFQGLAKIGTGLMHKILKPLIFAEDAVWDEQGKMPNKLRELKRPLLIIVIIHGAVRHSTHILAWVAY